MTAPQVRLHLYFARDCDSAVILRQGPSKTFRMILSNRADDSFEDGQWVRHKIYTERCDLSPDGRHFLYFALDGKWDSAGRGSFSAISRPPYFSALALFPQGDTWGGGGRFLDADHFTLTAGGEDIIGKADGLERVWAGPTTPDNATGYRRRDGSRAPLPRGTRKRLIECDEGQPPCGRYTAEDGCLYRCDGQERTLVRDLTDMVFEPIRAPYDRASP